MIVKQRIGESLLMLEIIFPAVSKQRKLPFAEAHINFKVEEEVGWRFVVCLFAIPDEFAERISGTFNHFIHVIGLDRKK